MPYEIAQKLFGPEMNEGLKFLLFHAVVILPTAYTDLGKKIGLLQSTYRVLMS